MVDKNNYYELAYLESSCKLIQMEKQMKAMKNEEKLLQNKMKKNQEEYSELQAKCYRYIRIINETQGAAKYSPVKYGHFGGVKAKIESNVLLKPVPRKTECSDSELLKIADSMERENSVSPKVMNESNSATPQGSTSSTDTDTPTSLQTTPKNDCANKIPNIQMLPKKENNITIQTERQSERIKVKRNLTSEFDDVAGKKTKSN